MEVSFPITTNVGRQTLFGYIVMAHEQVKVPMLASVPLKILEVEATCDRVVGMVERNWDHN